MKKEKSRSVEQIWMMEFNMYLQVYIHVSASLVRIDFVEIGNWNSGIEYTNNHSRR